MSASDTKHGPHCSAPSPATNSRNCTPAGRTRKFLTGERFGEAVRSHWGIENNLHWQLDVTFGEDACRVRKHHGSRNLNALRKFTLAMLKQETTCKNGIAIKRGKAGWDDEYLEKVLTCSQT